MMPVRWSRYEGIRQVTAGTRGSRVERSVLLISANLTGFHFHDLRHTGNALDGVARWPRQSYGNAQGHRARSGHGKGKRAS